MNRLYIHIRACVCSFAHSCLTQRPHGLQPTRLLHPRDFPGKSAGVGCHRLLRVSGLKQWKSGPGLAPSGGLRMLLLRASLPASAGCLLARSARSCPRPVSAASALCGSPLLTRTPVVLDEGLTPLQCDLISADYICSSLQISQSPRSWGVRALAQEFWEDTIQLLKRYFLLFYLL